MVARQQGVEPMGYPWQAAFLVILVGTAASVLAWASWGGRTITGNPVLVLGLAGAFFIARLLTIRLPQGDEVCVTLVVGLYAISVMDMIGALEAFAIAGVVDVFARAVQSTRQVNASRALDVVRGGSVLALMAPWQQLLREFMSQGASSDSLVAAVLLVGLVYATLDILTVAMQQRISGGSPVWLGTKALARSLGTIYLVHTAMAAVSIRLVSVPGAWAFPITLLLTLILQNSFNLYLRIRRAYAETIGALAHAAELDRPHDSGHSRRVADLSVAVGRKLGLSSHELERLGYAALLHDIGRIGEGASSVDVHVQRGAEIVGSIPFLADVAPLIDGEPHPESAVSQTCAAIVRNCSRYDRLCAEMGSDAALAALAARNGQRTPAELRIGEALSDLVCYRAETSQIA